VLFGGIFDRIW
jgi:hypothetical protein